MRNNKIVKTCKKILKINNSNSFNLVDDLIYGITKLLYAEGIEGDRDNDNDTSEEEKLLVDLGIREKRKNRFKIDVDIDNDLNLTINEIIYKFKYENINSIKKSVIIKSDEDINSWYINEINDKIFKIKIRENAVYDYSIFEYNMSKRILKMKYSEVDDFYGFTYKTKFKLKNVSLEDLKDIKKILVNPKKEIGEEKEREIILDVPTAFNLFATIILVSIILFIAFGKL